jgi:uncharacterized membrane protein YbhN (UPF0104 family)
MSEANQRNSWRGVVLRIGGSVLILSLLLWSLPLNELGAALRRLPVSLFLQVMVAYLATHSVATAKWRLMVNMAGAGLNYPQAAQCYFAGLFGNVFLPSIVGGDLIRAGLAVKMGRNRAGTLFGSVLDRMLDVAALGLVAGAGALLLPGALDERSRRVFWALAGVFALAAATGAALLALLPVRRFPFKVRRKLAKLRHAMRSLAQQPLRVVLALLLGVVIQSSLVLLNAVLGTAVGLNIPLHVWLFAWPIAKLSALLPVTQGGIGVREAALAGLLLPFGAAPAMSVAVGLVWEVVLVTGGLLGGLLFFLLARVTGARPAPAAPSVASET